MKHVGIVWIHRSKEKFTECLDRFEKHNFDHNFLVTNTILQRFYWQGFAAALPTGYITHLILDLRTQHYTFKNYCKLKSDITRYISSPLQTITQNSVRKSLLNNTLFWVTTIYRSSHLYGWLSLCCQLQWCSLSCGNSSRSGVPPRYSANWSGFHRGCTWKLALGGHTQTHHHGHEAQSL